MYENKCSKCGCDFETKNPKRVICPNCLYPDRATTTISPTPKASITKNIEDRPQSSIANREQRSTYQSHGGPSRPRTYGSGSTDERPSTYRSYGGPSRGGPGGGRPQGQYQQRGGPPRGGPGGGRPQGQYQQRSGPPRGGPGGGRPQGQYQQRGGPPRGGGRPQGQYQQRGGPPRGGGGFRGGPPRGGPAREKRLLVNKDQLAAIENLYKKMLPLPNPDSHDVIGKEIDLEPRKVFFGINLIRNKLMLPKLPYPKRKLAVTTDQLMAVESLYQPLLPLPPIGCHKIISKQLKMDEWRVHVAIGIIRKQMNLPRWNPDRPDAPEEFKNQPQEAEKAKKAD